MEWMEPLENNNNNNEGWEWGGCLYTEAFWHSIVSFTTKKPRCVVVSYGCDKAGKVPDE